MVAAALFFIIAICLVLIIAAVTLIWFMAYKNRQDAYTDNQ